MTNRFQKEKQSHSLLYKCITALAVFGCAAFLLLRGISAVSESADDSQIQSLKQAIIRSAVHCYAMEGTYPESLDYLREHYGITWDPAKYVIDYEITGSNLMPDVTVIPLH